MSGMTTKCERAVGESQLWYDYVCMLACVYGVYLIVGNKLSLGSFDTEIYVWVFIYGIIYITTQSLDLQSTYLVVGLC